MWFCRFFVFVFKHPQFYILHFTFANEILRRVARRDDRKGGHLLLLAFPPRGKVSAKPTEEGRRALQNFTFYILHFTFADEILRLASLAQDDRGGFTPQDDRGALLLRITGGRSRVLQDGRAAPCANNFILNFCQTIAKRQNSWYHNTAGACRRAMQ